MLVINLQQYMDKETVYVSPEGSRGWKVQFDHHPTQHANSKDEALDHAHRHIKNSPAGTVDQIKVQKSNGRLETHWKYGDDDVVKG